MIKGIGIDIEELDRFTTLWEDEAFVKRVLSPAERLIFAGLTHPHRKISFLAGRFAAKEAYTKAYRSFETPLNFTDVSIVHDASGAPQLSSKYRPEDTVWVSLAHSQKTVVATVVVEHG